jgi:hypothetical protein
MTYDPRQQEIADRYVREWSRDKPDFEDLRQIMAQASQEDINRLTAGKRGMGIVLSPQHIDLDRAYDIAKARKNEQEHAERRVLKPGEREDVRSAIYRSIRQIHEGESHG